MQHVRVCCELSLHQQPGANYLCAVPYWSRKGVWRSNQLFVRVDRAVPINS